MLYTADDMFVAISNFVLVKPEFNVKTVPEFLKLFYCSKSQEVCSLKLYFFNNNRNDTIVFVVCIE